MAKERFQNGVLWMFYGPINEETLKSLSKKSLF